MNIKFGATYKLNFQQDPLVSAESSEPVDNGQLIRAFGKTLHNPYQWLDHSLYDREGELFLFTNSPTQNSHTMFQTLLRLTGIYKDISSVIKFGPKPTELERQHKIDDMNQRLVIDELVTGHEDTLVVHFAHLGDEVVITNPDAVYQSIQQLEAE